MLRGDRRDQCVRVHVCWGGLNLFPGLPCDYPSVLYLHIVSSFDLDPYPKGTDGIYLSNNPLKGKTGSVKPGLCLHTLNQVPNSC